MPKEKKLKKFFIRVGERPVTYGTKTYGKGGEYEVMEDVARNLVGRNKAELIKGKLPEAPAENLATIDNEVFLNRIRQNASAILEILEDAAKLAATNVDNDDDNDNEEVNPADPEKKASEAGKNDSNEEEEDEVVTGDEIPEDFPGRETLAKNNITAISKIPTTKEGLMALDQMTGRVANQIGVKLGQVESGQSE